jgi:hypothetical protein
VGPYEHKAGVLSIEPQRSIRACYQFQTDDVFIVIAITTILTLLLLLLNPTLPSWKMLVFIALLAMLETAQRLDFVPQINTLLLGTPMLPAWWVKILTYIFEVGAISLYHIL